MSLCVCVPAWFNKEATMSPPWSPMGCAIRWATAGPRLFGAKVIPINSEHFKASNNPFLRCVKLPGQYQRNVIIKGNFLGPEKSVNPISSDICLKDSRVRFRNFDHDFIVFPYFKDDQAPLANKFMNR